MTRISLTIIRSDGSEDTNDQRAANDDMLAVAEDLLHTLTTGSRPPLTGLYDLVAKAFGTTRKRTKELLVAAAYSGNGDSPLLARLREDKQP